MINNYQENILLSDYTTFKIGGPARYFFEGKTECQIKQGINIAKKLGVAFKVIGGGSNLLVSDDGYPGLIIHNRYQGIKILSDKIRVNSGTRLQALVNYCVGKGLVGLENLSGIPGTVGGAVYGNAGAYGKSIGDRVERVKVYDGDKYIWLKKEKCHFAYRDSIFKKNILVIIQVELRLTRGKRQDIAKKAREILIERLARYPANLKCAGSFFRNILIEDVTNKSWLKVPQEVIVNGKIPAGYLLDQIGAKGMKKGGIQVTSFHGNIIENIGDGTATDCLSLARKIREKVKRRFRIELDPEVQLIGFAKKDVIW